MYKEYVEPVLFFILRGLWELKLLLGTLLIAWIIGTAIISWVEDLEQAAKRMYQLPYRSVISQQTQVHK